MADLDLSVPTTSANSTNSRQAATNNHPLHQHFTWMDFWLIVLMLIWGSNFVILKSALDILPPFVLNGIRFTAGSLALVVIFRLQGINLMIPQREWLPVIGLAFLNQVIYQGVWLWSLQHTTVANNALIIATVPVWVVLFNAWRGHERLSRPGLFGVLLSLAGVFLVVARNGTLALSSETLSGDLMAIVAAFIWAATIIFSRRIVMRNPPMPIAFWTVAWGGIFQLAIATPDIIKLDWSVLQGGLLIGVLYSGIVSIGIGSMIWNWAINRLGTGRPAVYTYLEPVVAAIAAVVFLHEAFSIFLIIGGVLVLAGVLSVKRG